MKFACTVFWCLLVSFGLSVSASAQQSPMEVDGATRVDAAAAKALFDEGATFVDVRPSDLWRKSHIPGAVYLDFALDFHQDAFSKIAAVDDRIVIYCQGPG